MPSSASALITPQAWYDLPDRAQWRVIDASWHMPATQRNAHAEFLAAHLPQAVFWDIDAIADRSTDLPHMLPKPEEFAAALGARGIRETDSVLVYDAVGLFSAPRVWWSLRAMGHRGRLYVLDGGLPAWRAAGLPIETGEAAPQAVSYKPEYQPDLCWDAARLLREADAVQVLDARSAARFSGADPEPRPGLRSGHMPGARNLPFSTLIADGRLLAPKALQPVLEQQGIALDASTVASCGSGITACVVALALHELGNTRAAVYDGSWAEWGARADLPVVR